MERGKQGERGDSSFSLGESLFGPCAPSAVGLASFVFYLFFIVFLLYTVSG